MCDSLMTVLMIWLVSDFCTLMLLGGRAKRWWKLLLSMKPLHPTWTVDGWLVFPHCVPAPADADIFSPS